MATIGRPITSSASAQPYRLHALLQKHGISHTELRRAIKFEAGDRAGEPIAASTLSHLLTRHAWPRTIRPESIRTQVAAFLAERGIPQEEIDTCWFIEGSDEEVFTPPTLLTELQPNQPAHTHHDEIPLPEAEMLSPAARMHFNLAKHPFIDDVQGPQDVYLSKEQRYVRESMWYAAKHSGFVAVIGESGSGKSTLRRDLVERIHRDGSPISIIQLKIVDKREVTTSHICDAIINDISTETPRLSKEAKARQVERLLAASARTGLSHVLIIEEAHDLNKPVLRYLKRFWELEDGFKRLLGIVLVGQPELATLLDERRNPDIREVIRRIEQATLKPLNGNLEEYLKLKFDRVGVQLGDVFESDAYDAIRNRLTRRRAGTLETESQLYPLIVHNLIVKCMNQAVELGLPKIGAELIGRV
ncbi:MAG: AAA family ATPase [Pseudomonadota bacterium]